MPHFENSIVDGRNHAEIKFLDVIVVEAPGGLGHEEVWLLPGIQVVDGWNNWVVAFRMVNVGREVPWIFHRIVPWWGEYLHANRTA